jgi:hypothetical protein
MSSEMSSVVVPKGSAEDGNSLASTDKFITIGVNPGIEKPEGEVIWMSTLKKDSCEILFGRFLRRIELYSSDLIE